MFSMENFTPSNNTNFYIQKPGKRTVFTEHHSFFLDFPYVIFYGTRINQYVVLCDEEPKLNSLVYFMPLGNVYSRGNYCTEDLCDKNSIEYFWASKFSQDLGWAGNECLMRLYKKSLISCFRDWQEIGFLFEEHKTNIYYFNHFGVRMPFRNHNVPLWRLIKNVNCAIFSDPYLGFDVQFVDKLKFIQQ